MVKGAGGIEGGFSEVMTFTRGLEPSIGVHQAPCSADAKVNKMVTVPLRGAQALVEVKIPATEYLSHIPLSGQPAAQILRLL